MRAGVPVSLIRDLIAPPRCATCGAAGRPREALCAVCARRLALAPPGRGAVAGIGRVTWCAPYEGTARELVAALKFRGGLGLARLAGVALAEALPDDAAGATVVPVPAAPMRRRARGFDPAELIAGELARIAGLALAIALARADGPRQVGRRRGDRLASAPRVWTRGPAPPVRVLLIDDVLTTGATLRACAAALRIAGCEQVEAAVFARAFGDRAPGA